ncbi:MAG: hypothetical protein HY322_04500 [Betaproteobacteria bacterium]|nr:hypothetical protein [Betaproteobacteria bacterium]
MIVTLFGLASHYLAPRPSVRLPFSRSELSREDYRPMVLSFTEKEVKRCVEALSCFMDANGEELARRGLDKEIGCYEDLLYRFMDVPDNTFRAQSRKEDRLN